MRKEKGITLIALVITIIVLLILAAVSIAMLTGENGILKKASTASEQTKMKNAEEAMKLVILEWKMEKNIGSTEITDFLNSKVPNELDSYQEMEDKQYELEKDGYVVTIDENGNIIEEIQKAGVRPKISNIKIILENGTEVEDNSQAIGTKLKITFDTSIEGGKITEVTPGTLSENGKVEYTTNGNEKTIQFTVKGEVDGKIYTTNKNISVENKYIISETSLIEAVEKIDSSSSNRAIQVEGKNEEVVAYNADIIVYDGDLTFDGEEKFINNINLSNKTYSIGDANNDVGTANSYAKNMVILKVNGDLTINQDITVTACASADGYGGPKGLFIYCTGTLTNNGTISMTARGAYAEGQNVYLFKNSDGTYEYVPAIGGTGGVNSSSAAVSGTAGINRQTGGGASGAGSWRMTGTSIGGNGGNGTSYSGGTGRRRRIKLFWQLQRNLWFTIRRSWRKWTYNF